MSEERVLRRGLRILHVLDHSLPVSSGYAHRTQSILRSQRALGWTTHQLTTHKQGHCDRESESVDGIEFGRDVSNGGSKRRSAWPFGAMQSHIRLRRRIGAAIREFQPDVLHAHSPCTNGLAVLGQNVPFVYEMRTLWEDGSVLAGRMAENGALHRLARAAETLALRSADSVVVISDGLRAEAIRRGCDPASVFVLPNGVEVDRIAPVSSGDRADARRRFDLDSGFVIAYIGSLFAWEGLGLLIEAAAKLRRTGKRVEVLIVGSGPDELALRNAVERCAAADVVRFAGQLSHAEALLAYAAADALVYPRLPMRLTDLVTPLKPLEAMARGKLVLASDVSGHRELVTHGENGLLFQAGSVDALCASIAHCMVDAAGCEAVAHRGLASVRASRGWQRIVSGYDAAYSAALRGRAPRG